MEQTAGKVGGVWTFRGDDMPLYRLYESLASGDTVDDFAAQSAVVVVIEYEADELCSHRLDSVDCW